MITEQDHQWTFCVCDGCGLTYTLSTRRATKTDYCKSCVAKPVKVVTYGSNGYCVPWQGDFDEWENPIQNGELYKPGVRTCGHRDCVREAHIQGFVRIYEPATATPAQIARETLYAQLDKIVQKYQNKVTHNSITVCELDGCKNKFLSKGLCSTHYARWLKITKKKKAA